jgi:TonB family protein
MKKMFLLYLFLSFISVNQSKAQQFGDLAERVKFLVQMSVQEYYAAQGYHQVSEDYNVIMNNGSISEVVLQKENVPDVNLRRPISFRIRYVMKDGKLHRVLQEYFDVNVAELVNGFRSNNRVNRINDYYFNSDYSTCTRIYLGANKLATSETKATTLSDFPPSIRELIKKDQLAIKVEENETKTAVVSNGQSQAHFAKIDKESEFAGGNSALTSYLQQNLRYPDSAGNNGIQGTVLVQFIVDTDGSVKNVEVLQGNELGYGLPQEAVRVVSNMPKWIPAQQVGLNIKSYKKMPVVFQLTEEDAKPLARFTGTNKFCDKDGTWYYKVSIAGNNITLQSYPGENNTLYKNKMKPIEVIHGVIRDGKIITKDPPQYKTNRFKFENGVLYEVNDEGEYNEYSECKN